MMELEPSNQTMKPTAHCEISSARLPRHPAAAYLFLVRCYAHFEDYAQEMARQTNCRSASVRSAAIRSQRAAPGLPNACLRWPSTTYQQLRCRHRESLRPRCEVMAYCCLCPALRVQLLGSRTASFTFTFRQPRPAKTVWTPTHLTNR